MEIRMSFPVLHLITITGGIAAFLICPIINGFALFRKKAKLTTLLAVGTATTGNFDEFAFQQLHNSMAVEIIGVVTFSLDDNFLDWRGIKIPVGTCQVFAEPVQQLAIYMAIMNQ